MIARNDSHSIQREFARRVVARNAFRADQPSIIGPCQIDGCTGVAFRPVGSNVEMICSDCRDEIEALRDAPPRFPWRELVIVPTLLALGVAGLFCLGMAIIAWVAS